MPGSAIRKTQAWLQDVGIIAMEVYFPSTYVEQSELEQFDSVSSGKYTIGLGQSKMGFCSDREDVNSLCLTVVKRLMERNNISYSDIGRMEVGTETIIDKSKSVKTVLMQLFEESGNFSVEGIDTTNACYGGTSALFNAVNWIESSYWDGRYALVVAGDIAVYATGNARCTGGAGAIAMLLGPNAPLIFDRGVRATYMQHAYDFYKPDMASEYPVVDGRLSIQCYLTALDRCYQSLKAKAHQMELCTDAFTLESANAFLFHSPYCKLVQKSFARLMLNDFLQDKNPDFKGKYAGLEAFRDVKLENSHFNKQVEQAFMKASDSLFKAKTMPSLLLANQVGNMYTPSLYGGLVAFLSAHLAAELFGKRLVFFSYGSGLASSMFSMHITDNRSLDSRLDGLLNGVRDLRVRLDARKKVAPKDFEKTMRLREETHHKPHYTPVGSVDDLFPGTWYLTHVDNMHRRKYERKPLIANEANSPVGSVSVPDLPDVRKAAAEEVSRSPAPVSS